MGDQSSPENKKEVLTLASFCAYNGKNGLCVERFREYSQEVPGKRTFGKLHEITEEREG